MSLNGTQPLRESERGSRLNARALFPSMARTFDDLRHLAKWLRLGMRVKRWVLVSLLGITILVLGVDLIFLMQLSDLGDRLNEWLFKNFGILFTQLSPLRGFTYQLIIGALTALLGLLVFLYGVRNILVSVTSAVVPTGNQPIVDVIWR